MRPIKIISDSTADLPKELIEKYDIEVLPLSITLGENSYKDGLEISAQDIFKYYEETKGLLRGAEHSLRILNPREVPVQSVMTWARSAWEQGGVCPHRG